MEDKYWFLRTQAEIQKELQTNQHGLTEHEAKIRLQQGKNKIADEKKESPLKILLKNFNNLLIYILLGAGIISLISNHQIEFYIIILIILLTGTIGFIQEYRAGKSLDALKKLTAKKVKVIREGKEKTILAEDLVQGDIILLERGMIAPADIRVIESKSLSADESILTGEPIQKPKHPNSLKKQVPISEQDNMIFSGTSIIAGKGKGIVVETGLNSELGKISAQIKKIGEQQSPLQKKIQKMSKRISYAVLAICIILFIILATRGTNIYEALLIIGAVAVSGIPESFPLALALALTSGIKKMIKENAIVKDLSSVETLGTTTVICTDKTGTLTQNKMLAEKIYLADGTEINIHGNGYEPEAKFTRNHKQLTQKELSKYNETFKACILCSNAETTLEEGEWKLKGEPTEGALLTLAKSAGLEDAAIREENPRIHEEAFDPSKKYMMTINSQGKTKTAYLKGSVESVLKKSLFIKTKTGKKKLTTLEKKKILDRVHKYSSETYRVLAIATKSISSATKNLETAASSGYVFQAIIAIRDPIRPDALQAIHECHTAGIRIIMVTGDHKATAEAIGKQLDLIKEDNIILEGHELENMTDEDLDKTISKVAIFARTTPEHKLRIVSSLQRKGEIVAMTGDGVNDAPALKKADIGVSMGLGGTEVARESSNMVLADDNFSTIVKAVKEGRTIYSNIRRFIYYLLTGNMTEVALLAITIIIGLITPLTALMVLFINLVTSTFPAIALSVEPTHLKVMNQKPRNPNERLLSTYILLKILVLVPVLFLGTLLLFQLEYTATGSIEKARTIAFTTLVLFELLHAFNARSLHTSIFNKHFFSNRHIFTAVLGSLLLTVLAVHTSLGNSIFGTMPLTAGEWITSLIVASSVIIISEIIKMLIHSEFEEQKSLRGINVKLE